MNWGNLFSSLLGRILSRNNSQGGAAMQPPTMPQPGPIYQPPSTPTPDTSMFSQPTPPAATVKGNWLYPSHVAPSNGEYLNWIEGEGD